MSVATIITEGFGSFGSTSFVITGGFGDYGGTPEPPTPTPTPEVTTTASGIKRRIRVRRSDFSTQANYEAALRAAMAGANFSIISPETTAIPTRRQRTTRKKQTVQVDSSLSLQLDREMRISDEMFLKLQRAADMEERELIEMFINVIEMDE